MFFKSTISVPKGTLITTAGPFFPDFFLFPPFIPFFALKDFLFVKSFRDIKFFFPTKIMLPPLPPSPPSGPPNGTYFSLLNEASPLPPFPETIVICT